MNTLDWSILLLQLEIREAEKAVKRGSKKRKGYRLSEARRALNHLMEQKRNERTATRQG